MVVIKSTELHWCGGYRNSVFFCCCCHCQRTWILKWFTVMCVKMTMWDTPTLTFTTPEKKCYNTFCRSYLNLLKIVTIARNCGFHTEIWHHRKSFYPHMHALTQTHFILSSAKILPLFNSLPFSFNSIRFHFDFLISLNGIILRVEVKRFYYIRIYI